jgi:PTH1 family peptidyl-tRNA hydrolase
MNTNKYLIVGLGNPEDKHRFNRHNIGYRVADKFAKHYQGKEFKHYSKNSLLSKVNFSDKEIYVLKPLTYMNLSGLAVKEIIKDFDISLGNVLIITDDISLDFGKLRLRNKGSAGGHNGLKNIEKELETDEYSRLKIGIGSDFKKGELIDFVLSNFTMEEELGLSLIHLESFKIIENFIN